MWFQLACLLLNLKHFVQQNDVRKQLIFNSSAVVRNNPSDGTGLLDASVTPSFITWRDEG